MPGKGPCSLPASDVSFRRRQPVRCRPLARLRRKYLISSFFKAPRAWMYSVR